MLEHLAEITAVDPAAAGRAPDEMLGLILRRCADRPAEQVPLGTSFRGQLVDQFGLITPDLPSPFVGR